MSRSVSLTVHRSVLDSCPLHCLYLYCSAHVGRWHGSPHCKSKGTHGRCQDSAQFRVWHWGSWRGWLPEYTVYVLSGPIPHMQYSIALNTSSWYRPTTRQMQRRNGSHWLYCIYRFNITLNLAQRNYVDYSRPSDGSDYVQCHWIRHTMWNLKFIPTIRNSLKKQIPYYTKYST